MADPEIKAEFKLTDDEKVYGPIVLGYPKNHEFPPRPENPKAPVMWM